MRKIKLRQVYGPIKWISVSFIIATTIFLISSNHEGAKMLLSQISVVQPLHLVAPHNNWRNFSVEQISKLSVLGRILFLDEAPPRIQPRMEPYKILVWKYGKQIEQRHLYHFTKNKFDPFEKCSVSNCEITYDEKEVKKADIVLVHLQRLKGVKDLPLQSEPRPSHQRWVFLTDENPKFTFWHSTNKINHFNGLFNWSMTYRFESDIPVPYGRTVLHGQDTSLVMVDDTPPKRSDVLVAIMGSNCGAVNHRWQYVRELQKYIDVHVYGKCGTFKCPGHFTKDCAPVASYKFYLSFENSNCAQYITEKLWWNAYAKSSIPVVMGASKKDYGQLLPPASYIAVEDFARPVDLARYILYVNKTDELYASYFQWKHYYRVVNEHGYFQTYSFHYCRLCEALNYNSRDPKVYKDLDAFWSAKDCYPKWDD